jgi:exosortase
MPFVRRFSLRAPFSAVFFAALWFILFRQLSGEWSVNDQYSYGWFVPFFAALLFWLRWQDKPKPETGNRKPDSGSNNGERITINSKARIVAIASATAALALLFPVRLFEIGNPDWRPLSWLHAICVLTITLVFLWWIGGARWLRHFSFPILFVLVAVPWVTPIEAPIIQGLMRSIAAISAEIANLLGVPAQVQGNLIRVPNGLVGVNEACSGVRSLQTSLMIGLLFGELKRLSIFRRILLIAGAIAIALIANVLRAVMLVWIGATEDISAIDRWHDVAGYGIVGLVFLGTLLLARVFRRQKLESRKAKVENLPRGNYFLLPTFYVVAAALACLVAVEVAAAAWYRAHEHELVDATRWEIEWPRGAPNFHELKIDEQVRGILRFDRGHAASWTLPATNSADAAATRSAIVCTLYFFEWNAGKNSALLANLHRPDVCLPAIGWNQTADTGVKNYAVAPDLSLPFRRFEFRHAASIQSRQVAHAFYCLWEDHVRASQPSQMAGAPSGWSRDERIRAVLDGRRHLGQQVMELILQTRGDSDETEIASRFASELPRLVKVKPKK